MQFAVEAASWNATFTKKTSNVTGRHRGPKQKLWAGYRAPSRRPHPMCRQSYFCLLDIFHCARHIFSSSSVVSHAFSAHACAMLVFDVWASSSPLGYPCAKFRFCCPPHCWASPQRKIVYSVIQSLTHPAYLICREPKLSLRNMKQSYIKYRKKFLQMSMAQYFMLY